MKKYLTVMIVLLIGCQSKSNDKTVSFPKASINVLKSKKLDLSSKEEKRFRDSLYTGESDNYISKIEEIPNREENAYRIIIKSKYGSWEKTKIINTRPTMSKISYCNDLYTVVSFPCGGPCHSEVFVFTNKTRPDEQYDYTEPVKNKPNIITHFRNEEFENIIVRNLANNKEMKINISEIALFSWDFIDSISMNKNRLEIHYTKSNDLHKIKTTDIQKIL